MSADIIRESTELGSWTDIVDLYRKLFSCIVTKESKCEIVLRDDTMC